MPQAGYTVDTVEIRRLHSMADLDNRAIIVTGAASGIGRAIAGHLANQGAFVGIFDLNEGAGG